MAKPITAITSPEHLAEMEERCNLTPQQLWDILTICAGNRNKYHAYLTALVEGIQCIANGGISFRAFGQPHIEFVLDRQSFNDLVNGDSGVLVNLGLFKIVKTKSPGGSTLNDVGRLGLSAALTTKYQPNLMAAAPNNLPVWAEQELEKTHNGFVQGLQSVCENIRTRSYMRCFSIESVGSLQSVVYYISGAIANFYEAMIDLYKGLELACLQAQIWINTQIEALNMFISNIYLTDIVKAFLAVVCLILSTIQTLIDDIAFFASLFDGSDNLYSALNAVQSVVNFASQIMDYVFNPVTSLLPDLFPKQAKQVLNFIDNIGKIPEHYLGFLLKSFNFNKLFRNRGIAIFNTIVQRYGLQAQLGDLGPILENFGTVQPSSNWRRSSAPVIKGPIRLKTRYVANPRSKWDGTLSGIFNFDSNPYFKDVFYDLGKSAGNLGALYKDIRKEA
jgi:hypothetical protein